MNRIRIGNDFLVAWRIKRAGINEDLTLAKNMSLVANVKSDGLFHSQIVPFEIIDDSIVRIEITPLIAKWVGVYNFVFKYEFEYPSYLDNNEKCTVDKNIFIIVGLTADADDINFIECESDVLIGLKGEKGDSAFVVWQKENGADKTYQDWIEFLQSPANDAIADADAATVRANNAADLANTKAGLADDAATLATQKAGLANDAADLANEKAGDANDAAILANSKAGEANDAAIRAESSADDADAAAGLANSAANLANEKAGEANEAAILANEKAGEANTQALYAKEQGDYALEQGDYAKEQGELAQTAREGIEGDLALKIDKSSITSELGDSEELVMSQKGVKDKLALKADHGYVSNPKTLKEVEDLLRELAGTPDVFGFRYLIDQADDRVEAVNDVAYDYATGVAPSGSKRAKLLSKLRPFQCNLDGSNKEFLQDDVRLTVGWKPSDLTNPLKLQMVQIPRFYYRSFQHEGYNYVLFSEVAPELIATFTDATQWKEIQPCGYARYRGVRQLVEGQQMLLSYSGQYPTTSVNLINFQTSAKNTNVKATVIPYFIYEAITLLMTMELGRRNAQAFYAGITDASESYANAAVTGVTDVLTTPSGEVDVEWQPGSFTKQFRWRFIECVYGQIWNILTGIYYVYDASTELNKVYMTRDFGKINTNSNYAEHVLIGSTPSVNGWIKEFIPGTIVASELGGSSTTYAADYNYTGATTTIRIARAGGYSNAGGAAGPFTLNSINSPEHASAARGASLVLPE